MNNNFNDYDDDDDAKEKHKLNNNIFQIFELEYPFHKWLINEFEALNEPHGFFLSKSNNKILKLEGSISSNSIFDGFACKSTLEKTPANNDLDVTIAN